MISADTNIFARVILNDDRKQSHIAQEFLEHHTQKGDLYVSPYMLLELVWLLKSKGLERQQIVLIIEKLIHIDGIMVGQKNILLAALRMYAANNIGFADCLITCDASVTASAKTVTFDRSLQKVDERCVAPT
jgi:predicted nucleic-acid-binding protein